VTAGPDIDGVYETALYASDIAATAAFFTNVVGLQSIDPPDDHSAAFRLNDGNVLLLFDPARTNLDGRFVPLHGAAGPGHVAFRVAGIDPVAEHLRIAGVDIEREITWPSGGRSVYVRDPAGNSVEFVEGDIW
jgi:catechol 2,3-dioxygenase-like lactoylglutathione lyase family enzyme